MDINQISFGSQFIRQYAAPIDRDMVFLTVAMAQDYLSSPRRYQGQIMTCLEKEGSIFVLNNTKDTWIDIADGSTIPEAP